MSKAPHNKHSDRITFHMGVDPGQWPALCTLITLNGVFLGCSGGGLIDEKKDGRQSSEGLAQIGHPEAVLSVMNMLGTAGKETQIAIASAMHGHPTFAAKPALSIVTENTALSVRPNQKPQDAVKLALAYGACVAASMLFMQFWNDDLGSEEHGKLASMGTASPKDWRAFYALGLSNEPTKKASVTMAFDVYDELSRSAVEQVGEGALDCLLEGTTLERDDLNLTAGITPQFEQRLNDHNFADAFLIAARDFFISQHGWDFYRPLAKSASVN